MQRGIAKVQSACSRDKARQALRCWLSKRLTAYEAFAQARKSDPGNVNACFEPGWFLLARDRPEKAYPLLKSAAGLPDARMVLSNDWYSIVRRADLSEQEKRAELDQHIRHVLDLRTTEPQLIVAAAGVYGLLDVTDQWSWPWRVQKA